ncbi:hypothetical protein O0L34_g7917 [Tuta absoluta]|nr:hypothetical protein O0L34_g7917 [Tuta absoluta]
MFVVVNNIVPSPNQLDDNLLTLDCSMILEHTLDRYDEEADGEGQEDGEAAGGISISVSINTGDQHPQQVQPQSSVLLTVDRADGRRLVHQRHSLRRSSAIDSSQLPSPMQPLLGDDDCGEVLLPVPRQPSAETNASSDMSLSHMVSENLPPRPSIVLDSSQLPRQRSAEQPPQPHTPTPARPETMC